MLCNVAFQFIQESGETTARFIHVFDENAKLYSFIESVKNFFGRKLLQGIDATDLVVYKSRGAFDHEDPNPQTLDFAIR